MIDLKATTETGAKIEAIKISKANPGEYVTVGSCFGLVASKSKRLNVFSPGDSVFNWYVKNGKVKQFTDRQVIADQNATPTMN